MKILDVEHTGSVAQLERIEPISYTEYQNREDPN